MKIFLNSLFATILFVSCVPLSLAVVDIYEFDTESQRQRYHALIEVLRCPKCQNQNLAGSDSQIAEDLRRELHRMLLEGKTDREIKRFMVDRYGDFVLYKPRLQKSTALLWILPIALLLLGLAVIVYIVRSRDAAIVDKTSSDTLSSQEQQQLKNILDNTATDENSKGQGTSQ